MSYKAKKEDKFRSAIEVLNFFHIFFSTLQLTYPLLTLILAIYLGYLMVTPVVCAKNKKIK